ncbi:MAG: hypothetical protein ACRD0C_11505 [Acidimicrobiia bacterium]
MGTSSKLSQVQAALESSGTPIRLEEPASAKAVPTLVVDLGADDGGRPRNLLINLMPVEDEVDATDFLQYLVPLPFDGAKQLDEVRLAVTIVNNFVAIGHFGVTGDGGLFYRYVLATPSGEAVDPGMTIELVQFITYHQEHYADYLEGVCQGEISVLVLEDVLKDT